jgi:RNA polymerase sigma-70 factor (ECF subfamily)
MLRDSRFQEWLICLEPAERDLIILRFVEDLGYEELALALGIPTGTVKWRLFNAKKKLSKSLERQLTLNAARKVH